MQVRIWPASLPPPMASKAIVAPVSTSACVRSSMKVGEVELQMYLAPMSRSSLACSSLRTMLTRSMPSLTQIRLSICPRLEAAAVCTRALWPSRRMVSTMPSAVSGLTKHEAPSAGLVPGGSTRPPDPLPPHYRHRLHRGLRNGGGDDRAVAAATRFGRRHVGRAGKQPQVRRIDRRGLDANNDLIGTGFRRCDRHQRQFKFAAVFDQRAKLKSCT